MTWTDRAACRDGTYAAQLTSDDRDTALAAARAVCPGCPVRVECAQAGRERREWGVYGGTYLADGKPPPARPKREPLPGGRRDAWPCETCGQPMAWSNWVRDDPARYTGARRAGTRDLCVNCAYHAAEARRRAQTGQAARVRRQQELALEEIRVLRAHGYTREQIARRLGVTPEAVYQVERRAKRARAS